MKFGRTIWVMALVAATALLVFSHSSSVSADVNDFDITSFSADYYIDKTAPHGAMRVVERIEVFFRHNNHGILRAIPSTYKDNSVQLHIHEVKKPNGDAWPYTTYSENDNMVLRIGDPNQMVTGAQTFIVEYDMQNVMSFYKTHDELFWDINGDQWRQRALAVRASFHFEDNIKLEGSEARKPRCYTGFLGSTSSACQITETGNTLTATTTETLLANQTMSVVMAFPKGTFEPYGWQDVLRRYASALLLMIGATILFAVAFRKWSLYGKDYKGKGVIVPQYSPPKQVDVLSAGVLQDYRLDNRDITAAIVALAVRGYLKIIERDSRKLLVLRKTTTSLQLVKVADEHLSTAERQLLQALFGSKQVGEEIAIGTYNAALSKAVESLRKQTANELVTQGLLESHPLKAKNHGLGWVIVLLVILLGLSIFIGAILAIPIIAVVLVLCFIMLASMARRSHLGVEAHEQLQGLKMYLQVGEAERLRLMQGPRAAYAQNAHEPKRTVSLFEKLLPYAIVLGVEKGWAKQFESIYTSPPEWYEGNWQRFNAIALTQHLNSSASALGSTFTAPSSSSGSGFSGGGSGGGGGGGGGGGW